MGVFLKKNCNANALAAILKTRGQDASMLRQGMQFGLWGAWNSTGEKQN
jgi:hypothetical protein